MECSDLGYETPGHSKLPTTWLPVCSEICNTRMMISQTFSFSSGRTYFHSSDVLPGAYPCKNSETSTTWLKYLNLLSRRHLAGLYQDYTHAITSLFLTSIIRDALFCEEFSCLSILQHINGKEAKTWRPSERGASHYADNETLEQKHLHTVKPPNTLMWTVWDSKEVCHISYNHFRSF